MCPIIGIPMRYEYLQNNRPIIYLPERLRRTIQQAGGYVFPIAPIQNVDYITTKNTDFIPLTEEEKKLVNTTLDNCDALLFPGGIKFTPYDRYLLECAIEKDLPILGICLGMQLMSCYQSDVNIIENSTAINHYQEEENTFTHTVTIEKNSKLYHILNKEEITVNSFHKRHIIKAPRYNVVAKSSDGIIEGIEYPGNTFNIGVQWHPEISYEFDSDSQKIIEAFINAARENHTKKSQLLNK